jgi:hypothetical protein
MRGMATALLALLSVVGVASAQTDQPIARGARVRVTPSAPSRRVVGQLIALSDSALVVRSRRGGTEILILRSKVLRLEVSRGTNRGESALRGALLGAIIGGVIGYASVTDESSLLDRRGGAVIGGFYGVATGSLMGVLIGSVERWRNVAVPMSLSVMPTSEGSMSIGGRIAF